MAALNPLWTVHYKGMYIHNRPYSDGYWVRFPLPTGLHLFNTLTGAKRYITKHLKDNK